MALAKKNMNILMLISSESSEKEKKVEKENKYESFILMKKEHSKSSNDKLKKANTHTNSSE